MTDYTINSLIPAPAPKTRLGRNSKYPFHTMRVGDSFVIPEGQRSAVAKAASMHRSRYAPWCFVIDEDADGDVRCWRVEDAPKYSLKALVNPLDGRYTDSER